MVLELGHPINGDTLRVLGNAAGVQCPNQSMFNPKDKKHAEYALQLLRRVTRVGVALQLPSNCPYRYSFKYKKALEKKHNVPRKCPVPMCPASPFTLNIKCHLRLVHPGLDPETIEVSDWIVEKQIVRRAPKTKAEKGEKLRRITIHVDKEAEEGTGQATTTGDGGGDKYGTQQPASEADENWRPERRTSDESDRSDTDSS